jgi:hypothetical protein
LPRFRRISARSAAAQLPPALIRSDGSQPSPYSSPGKKAIVILSEAKDLNH